MTHYPTREQGTAVLDGLRDEHGNLLPDVEVLYACEKGVVLRKARFWIVIRPWGLEAVTLRKVPHRNLPYNPATGLKEVRLRWNTTS